MRKDSALPILALAGGAAGFFLRRWQLASAYQPETELFVSGAPATYALLGLTALLAAVFLLFLREKREGLDDFLPAFGNPCPFQMAALAASWVLFSAAGGFSMQAGFRGLRMWQNTPELYQFSIPAAQLLAGGLCILGGFGVLFMGRMAYRWTLNDASCWLASFPAFAGLLWLFDLHLRHGTQPVLMKYGFILFAALLLTLAHYCAAGFLFGRPRPRCTAFCALLGTVLAITALADRPSLFDITAALAFTLSALTFTHALLAAPWRMPPPEEESQKV